MSKNTQKHIIVIGAANADITGISSEPLKFNESNPGKMNLSAGGVARNVADNFARLSQDENITTYLLSAIGDDVYGDMVAAQSRASGVNLSHCQTIKGASTASYFCIIDYNGELRSAINDMSIVEQINVEYLASKAALINQAELIFLDMNLTQQAVDYVCQNFNHIPIFVDTVSISKASKLLPNLKHVFCITPNLNEAEFLSDISARHEEDLPNIADFFHNKGVPNIYITLGSKGVFTSYQVDKFSLADILPAYEGEVVNTNGAGDAFTAGLIYGFVSEFTADNRAKFAQACAFINTHSKHTINKKLDRIRVTELMESAS